MGTGCVAVGIGIVVVGVGWVIVGEGVNVGVIVGLTVYLLDHLFSR